ncbi:MAG: tetratricopeptide repeat protein [Desulfuromonadales bacterium]|uniref:tetratricopeptide repeat protein n=1 Tax=Desulfuromonas sp. KJ2020 TaxID=2919173 RepID=UPI000324282B|nr:tetratricopeptide repeat protein [Desulfuromonas sp. KJ2020]MCP3175971.1 hypothetical protein [Desulfuromonas sp. KJ2020]
MTLMAFLLLIILFLVFFIYFLGLNPQDITLFFLPDQPLTYPVAIVVVGAVLLGLVLGYGAYIYSTFAGFFRNWRKDRAEKKNKEVTSLYREGVGRLLSGDIKKAHTLLQKTLDRDPSRVETYIALASVYIQESEPREAINLLLKAKNIDPRNLEIFFKMATTYEEMGLLDDAALAYQEIITLESDNRKALRALRDIHINSQRWPEALELQKRLMKVGVSKNRLADEKAKLLFIRYEVAAQAVAAGKGDEAKDTLKDIIKQDSGFTPARVSLGDIYQAENRAEEAARTWQEGYKALSKSIFLSRLEELYMGEEDPSTLLSFYRSAIVEKPQDLLLRLFFGRLCLRLEMVDEALENLYAVESSGIEFPQLHSLLAEAHRRRNRFDDAIREYQKALGINAHLSFGYVCEECGDEETSWKSRCAHCGTWGSFALPNRSLITGARPLEVREIHHGEREAWQEED